MTQQLNARLRYMAKNLEGMVPELMEASPLITQDGEPFPDVPTGIYGNIVVNALRGGVSIKFTNIPRGLTVTQVRLVELKDGAVAREMPFLHVPHKWLTKGDGILFPIPLTVKPKS